MQVDESTYKRMPKHMQGLFIKLDNPSHDEVVDGFPDSKGQLARARTDGAPMNNKIYGALNHVSSNPEPRGDTGSAARFFYCAKASKKDRAGSKHPTVKPVALMRWLVRLVTPPGGVVLDPFAGTGTTGEAALLEGMRPVLLEADEGYYADLVKRMEAVNPGSDDKPIRKRARPIRKRRRM